MLYKPFMKWAGGKRGILQILFKYTPRVFNNYFEPFVGGGALFFYMRSHPALYNVMDNRFTLVDSNAELINCYKLIQSDPHKVLKELLPFKDLNNKQDFYKIRCMDKDENFVNLDPFYKAARFIYLNKVSFSGMCRYNSKGQFNVPYGEYKNPSIYNEELILSTHEALKTGTILCDDFEAISSSIQDNDFVYFDPPYDPISKTSNFTTYTTENFQKDEHIRLRDFFNILTEKGVLILLSNSNTEFVKDLYKDHIIIEINAPRMINGAHKDYVKELLIMNKNLERVLHDFIQD